MIVRGYAEQDQLGGSADCLGSVVVFAAVIMFVIYDSSREKNSGTVC